MGCGFVVLCIALIRRLTGVWQAGVLAGIMLAFSAGIALAYRSLRGSSELLSSALVFIALLVTLIAARERGSGRRPFYLGLAALLVALAMTEKVQALIPALTIPMVALTFGEVEPEPAFSKTTVFGAIVLCSLGAAIALPALNLMEQGIANMPGHFLHPIASGHGPAFYRPLSFHLSGLYQWLLLAYVLFSMLLYASVWRVREVPTATSVIAVLVGLGLGLLILHGRYNLNTVVAVTNPIEHLQAASGSPDLNLPTTAVRSLGEKLLKGLASAVAIHTFLLQPSNRPTLLVEWISIFAAYVLWRRGERQAALQIGALLLAAILIDASFTLRAGMEGVKIRYAPYADPFIILAGAMALARFQRELLSLKAQRALFVFLLVYVVWGHFEVARATYGGHPKSKVCVVAAPYLTRVSIPYCQNKNSTKSSNTRPFAGAQAPE
jgi:hypothetical protein